LNITLHNLKVSIIIAIKSLILKKLINLFLRKLGYELKTISSHNHSQSKLLAEGFPEYLKESRKAGMDVNDFINSKLGNPAYDIQIILKKELSEFKSPIFCELGVGTGRWTKEIIKILHDSQDWKIYAVDHSEWIVDFLKNYFINEKNVIPLLNDGLTLPFPDNNFLDLIFCQGMFIELKLSNIMSYAFEFSRTLKPNGIAVFNYIDLKTDNGWNHLRKQSTILSSCFTYHTTETIDRIFTEAGFVKIKSLLLGNSTYSYFRKL